MIRIYTRSFCNFCTAAKQLLEEQGYDYKEISLEANPDLSEQVFAKSGQRTVPQVFVGERSIGGFSELYSSIASEEFPTLIAGHGGSVSD